MNLHRVKANGCILYFPPTLPHSELLRGGKGYVVDLDAPLEREWCVGQEHKLEPAPDAKAASPIGNPIARRLITAELARRAAQPTPEKPAADASTATSQTTATAAPAATPEDDLEVKRPRAAKAGAA